MDDDSNKPEIDATSDDKPSSASQAAPEQTAPPDALSRTPEDLDEEAKEQLKKDQVSAGEPVKQPSKLRSFLRRFNVYFLGFVLLCVIVGVATYVYYLNDQKVTPDPDVATKELSQDELKQLANTDVSVGSISQTMTIKGNAIIDGQSLMRGNLDVAGNFQAGGSIRGSSLTISGEANLGGTQVNSLQVAQDATIQGATSTRDLSVTGTASFSGQVSAPQITVSRLTIANNGTLEVPGHISYAGGPVSRGGYGPALGSGGSANVNGNDTTGTVNINTGNGASSGCFVRVNFNQAYSQMPHVLITPVGPGAGTATYYVTRDTAGFSVCANQPPSNRNFAIDYYVAG